MDPLSAGATVNILVSYQVPPAALAGQIAYITNGNLAVGQFYSFAYDLVVPSTMHAGIINDSGATGQIIYRVRIR